MTSIRCPICGKAFSDASPSVPFCSPRCRRIDLGRWLREDYSVPVIKSDEDGEEESPDVRESDDE